MMPREEGGVGQTKPEELIEQALKHYEKVSSRACNWSSLIPKAIKAYQYYLEAASELPGKTVCPSHPDLDGIMCEDCHIRVYENDIIDKCVPILARKNEEVAMLKKENEELTQELEACRDANVQKKKRIADLESSLKRAEGLKERFKVVLESLVDMVNQHCQSKVADNKDFYVDHACLSANEDAFYVLEQLGLLKQVNGRESILSFDVDMAIDALLATRKGSE